MDTTLPGTIVIDPRGDLQLVVHGPPGQHESGIDGRNDKDNPPNGGNANTDTRTFLVCSRALARASPVFERMLYGYFAEAQRKAPWIVELHDDKVKPMTVLLQLMHGDDQKARAILRYTAYPDKKFPHDKFSEAGIWITDIYDLMILTDKYQMADLFVAWSDGLVSRIRKCLNQYTKLRDEFGPNDTLPQILWICYELGAIGLFKSTLKHMVTWTEIDDRGALLYRNTQSKQLQSWFAHIIEPGDLSDYIRHERIKALSTIPEWIGIHFCAQCWNDECRELQEEDRWPIDAERFTDCLYSIIIAFQASTYYDEPGWRREGSTDGIENQCACQDITDTDGTGLTIPDLSKLPKTVKNHLKSQAIKTGLASQPQKKGDYLAARQKF
ncbi:hypothetical protein GGR57DRAFT_499965 [Xylariaceae sp. FL1272]|nr:hypothetical protein GGR57DRAFT_499965 [Xylariaceae sp. FL1272]